MRCRVVALLSTNCCANSCQPLDSSSQLVALRPSTIFCCCCCCSMPRSSYCTLYSTVHVLLRPQPLPHDHRASASRTPVFVASSPLSFSWPTVDGQSSVCRAALLVIAQQPRLRYTYGSAQLTAGSSAIGATCVCCSLFTLALTRGRPLFTTRRGSVALSAAPTGASVLSLSFSLTRHHPIFTSASAHSRAPLLFVRPIIGTCLCRRRRSRRSRRRRRRSRRRRRTLVDFLTLCCSVVFSLCSKFASCLPLCFRLRSIS